MREKIDGLKTQIGAAEHHKWDDIYKSWLEIEENKLVIQKLDLGQLKEELLGFSANGNGSKYLLASTWLEKPDNKSIIAQLKFEELKETLPSFGWWDKAELFSTWSENNELDFEKFKTNALSLDSKYKFSFATSWLERNELDFKTLKGELLLPLLETLPDYVRQNRQELIISKWLKKSELQIKELKFEEFKELLPLCSSEDRKLLISEFFEKESEKKSLNFEGLKLSLGSFENDMDKKLLALEWFKKPENKLSIIELKELLSLFTDEASKVPLSSEWFKKLEDTTPIKGLKFQELEETIPLFGWQDQPKLFLTWFENNPLDFAGLKNLLPLFKDNSSKQSSALEWLQKPENKLSIIELKELLSLFRDDWHKQSLVSEWIKKSENQFDFKGLKTNLGLFDSDSDRQALALEWLKIPGNTLDFKVLKDELLSLFQDDSRKESLIEEWLKKSENQFDFEVLKVRLPLCNGWKKRSLASEWLENEKNKTSITKLTFDELKEAIVLFPDRIKIELASIWFKNVENKASIAELEFSRLKELFSLPISDSDKQSLASEWLENEGNKASITKLTFDELKETIVLFPDVSKKELASIWFGKDDNKLNFDQLKEALPSLPSELDRQSLTSAWVQIPNNRELITSLDFSNLKESLKLFLSDGLQLASQWLKKEKNNTYGNLKRIIGEDLLGSVYNYPIIASFCRLVDTKAEALVDLCRDLYPNNEFIQAELFFEFTDRRLITKENIDLIKNFIGEIKDLGIAADLAGKVIKVLGLSEVESLQICSGVVSGQYESISDLLKGKELSDYLKPQSLTDLAGRLSLSTDSLEFKAITLEALFSYHVITGAESAFVDMIKPEKLDELRSGFKLPEKRAYFSEKEVEHLKTVLGDKMPDLVSTQVLSDYLKDKVKSIIEYTDQEISDYEIVFPKESVFNKDKKQSLNEEFRRLFKSPNPTGDELSDFLIKIAGQSENLVNPENRRKIESVFREQKNNFAELLQDPEGVYWIAGLFTSNEGLGHGCPANVGTHFQDLMNGMRIKDPIDAVLNSFLVDEIASSVFGKKGEDHLGASGKGTDVYTNTAITKTFLSPTALAKELKEALTNDADMMWKIIDKEVRKICKVDEKIMAEIKSELVDNEFETEKIKAKELELIPLVTRLIFNQVLGDKVPKDLFKKEIENIPSIHLHVDAFKTHILGGHAATTHDLI